MLGALQESDILIRFNLHFLYSVMLFGAMGAVILCLRLSADKQ